MSGWDFLEEYKLLGKAKKAGIVVCMLSTSNAAIDRIKADGYDDVSDYSSKPLSKQKLMALIEQHFPDYL